MMKCGGRRSGEQEIRGTGNQVSRKIETEDSRHKTQDGGRFQLIIGEDISNCRFQILFDGNCGFGWCMVLKRFAPLGIFEMPNGAVPARFLSKSYLL